MEMQIMKRILSLIVSLGLVFSAHGHSISDYVMAATPGTGDDGTLLRMLTEDSGLNNVAIVEAGLLAKGGFEYQDVIAMPFDIKQQSLQESIATGSPLMVDPGLGAFSAGGASEGDSLGGVLPATFYEPATVAYVSSLPADWGVAITDANNLAELEAFLFAQASIYRGNYAALTAATLGEKIHEMLRITGSLPPEIVEVVEPVVVPTPAVTAVVVPTPAPVVVPTPAPAAGGESAERIIAYLDDKLDGAQQANLRTYSDTDLKVVINTMINTGKPAWLVKNNVEGAGFLSPKAAPVVPTTTPAVPAPTPADPTPTPAAGARPNMAGAFAQITGGGAALKPADGVFTKGDKAASEAVQAQLKDFVKKAGELKALLTARPFDQYTPDITSKLNYYIAVADYIKSARNQSGFERADEAVNAWFSKTYLTLKSLVEKDTLAYANAVKFRHNIIDLPEVAQSGKLIDEEEEDFDDDETVLVVVENTLPNWMAVPFKAEYDKQKATPPAVSGGGMGGSAPMPMPMPAPRPGGMGAPAPTPTPAATGLTRPNLPPPPSFAKPAATSAAPASLVVPAAPVVTPAPSSGSVSPSGMSGVDKLAKAEQLITKYGLADRDLTTFNGFVVRILESRTTAFDMPSFVFNKNPIAGSTSSTDKAKAEFLIATGQTAGAKAADVTKWKTNLGLA